MRKLLIAVLLAAGCAAPSNLDPGRYGSVSVSLGPIDPSVGASDRTAMQVSLTRMRNVGPEINGVDADADLAISVTVEDFGNGPGFCVNGSPRDPMASGLTSGEHVCFSIEERDRTDLLARGAAYILGRHLRMSPICRTEAERTYYAMQTVPELRCSSVGIGVAVMNPFGSAYPTPTEPTSLDIGEFRRAHP